MVHSFTPQGLAHVAWALGSMAHRDPALMEALAGAALGRLEAFSPHELSMFSSGFAGGWRVMGGGGRGAGAAQCSTQGQEGP